ncbi:hypothetical protein RB195_017053 [Necator americanus]|uniref:BPTI/Kunitz inhibitor domain-containing protein n=1 Tax=Necator americanus TaxID=51031 RepID=A0ABR1C5K1_NECAM
MMYGSESWAAPSTVMERLDCTERKLLRRLLGYFWPRVCHSEDLYAEIDVVYRRMTRARHQHLAPPSKVAKVNRLRFFRHILRRPADRLVQRILRKYGIATNGLILCKLPQKIEKVGQSCVQGRHISAKMRIIASGDDISPPTKSRQTLSHLRQCVLLQNGHQFGSNETFNACYLPIDSGLCRGSLLRYAYDSITNQCLPFMWTGCGGNMNRFKKKYKCELACRL